MNARRGWFPAIVAAAVTAVPLLVIGTGATSATTRAIATASPNQRVRAGLQPSAAANPVTPPGDPLALVRAKASVQPPLPPPLVPGEIRVPSVGADMFPVPAGYGVEPKVSSAQATEVATSGAVSKSMLATSSATLMIFSNKLGADPSTTKTNVPLAVAPTLTWVVTFHGGEPFVAGPITRTTPLPPMSCEYVVAIDAVSGVQLDAYQACHAT